MAFVVVVLSLYSAVLIFAHSVQKIQCFEERHLFWRQFSNSFQVLYKHLHHDVLEIATLTCTD